MKPTDWNRDAVLWDTDGVIRVGGSSARIACQDIDSDGDLTSYHWCRRRTRSYGEKCQNGRESKNVHCIRARESTIWCFIGDC